MAAHRKNDLGDPNCRNPLETRGPTAALAKAGLADRGALLMALAGGGLPTETRLHRADRLASPACRRCGAARGNPAHHLRHCGVPTAPQTRLEPARRAAEAELYGAEGPPKGEYSIWTRGMYPEAVARWNAVALAAARHGMSMPCNTIGINGPIASGGGVLGSDHPLTALGSWAWVSKDHPEAAAAGIVPRRPGGAVSTALAEATALAQAAAAAGPDVVFIVDNLGTTRAKAILADLKDNGNEVPELLIHAERLERLAEEGAEWHPREYQPEEDADPLQDAEQHVRPSPLMGPSAAATRLIPKDGAIWRTFREAARATGNNWDIILCPSHLLDKNHPDDANIKYDKANMQPGWKDSYMKLNLEKPTPSPLRP